MGKKFLIGLFILSIFTMPCCFGTTIQNQLKSKIELIEKETNTYGGENFSLEDRLKNIEIYVFGFAKNGDLNQRTISVAKVLGIPLEQSVNESPKYEIEDNNLANYPSVDKLEQQNFGKMYKNENIYSRLDRLEKKAFGKISYKSLNERVMDLQEKYQRTAPLKENENNSFSKANNTYSANSKDYNYYSPNTADPIIAKIEQKLWKHSFDKDTVPTRLSRIEDKMFGQKFEHESESTRLERIKSVIKAHKSGGEYKANKFAKYATTGLQIGGLVLLILAMIL